MNKYLIFLFILILGIIFPFAVHAQNVSFSIQPAMQHVLSKPGQTIQIPYQFVNLSDLTTAKIVVKQLSVNNTTGEFEIQDTIDTKFGYSLVNSDIFLNNPFSFRPKEAKNTTLQLTLPDNLPEKDYYFGIFIESQPTPSKEGVAALKLKDSVGSLVMISISSDSLLDTDINIPLVTVKTNRLPLFGKSVQYVDSQDTIAVKTIVHNAGKNFTVVQGKLELKRTNGKTFSYPFENKIIPAESQRVIYVPSVFCNNSDNRECKEDWSMVIGKQPIGKYSLSATVVDKNSLDNSNYITEFYVLPVKATFYISIFFVVIITSVFIYILKKYKKR